jgi:prepilin-type N-terminal cleavage/methylation domain-containing protein
MSQTRGTSQQGFTIVEVLIVLAIAGLILLLVFQAIPTLNRSSTNGQRKQGVAAVLRAVSRYELNNSGNMPVTCSGGACLGVGTFLENEKLIYYDGTGGTNISLTVGSQLAPVSHAAITNTDTVAVYNYQRCDPTVIGAGTAVAAGYSDVVALYAIATGSGGSGRCQQL